MENEVVLQLDPSVILAEDNSRFNLKPLRVAQLAESIKESGGVNTPIEVTELEKPSGKVKYRLTAGFYRHAAVTKLNTEEKAGLTLPALVRTVADEKERLRRQLSENMDRENQSPMDKAVAIKRLQNAGYPKLEIRRIFSTPGGRKGLQLNPASNAFINMTLSFLALPKTIQEKIHDGRIGVASAYELTKVAPDKRQVILERAEAERLKEVEREEKDEERFLAGERKVSEAQTKAEEAAKAVDGARADIVNAGSLVEQRIQVLRDIQKTPFLELDEAGKREVTEKLKAAEADVKGAQKTKKDSENKLSKLLQASKSADEQAADRQAKLDAAKKKKKKVGKTATPKDIKTAAKAEGEGPKLVALNASEMRQALKDIIKASSPPPKVKAIAEALMKCFGGESTPRELGHDLGVITGEIRAK